MKINRGIYRVFLIILLLLLAACNKNTETTKPKEDPKPVEQQIENVIVNEDFKIDKDFLALAAKGKMKGTKAQLGVDMTIQEMIDIYGQPEDKFYWDGGLGWQYGDFVYFVDAYDDENDTSKTLNTINVMSEEAINMTMPQIKATIGEPTSEGWSEVDDSYFLYYEIGKYAVFIDSASPEGKAYQIMIKPL